MRFLTLRSIVLSTLMLPLAPLGLALAAPPEAQLPAAAPRAAASELLEAEPLGAFKLTGGQEFGAGVEEVAVEGQQFKRALRARVERKPPSLWKTQISTVTRGPVEKGDALLLTLWVRGATIVTPPAPEGQARLNLVFEQNRDKFTKSLSVEITAEDKWKKIQLPFACGGSYPAGGAQLGFQFGQAAQSIEIGGVMLQNFGKVKVSSLPKTGFARSGPAVPLEKLRGGVEMLAPGKVRGFNGTQGLETTSSASEYEFVPGVKGRVDTQSVDQKPLEPSLVRIDYALAAPVVKGDTLVASFYLRGTPRINPVTGRPRVTLALEMRGSANQAGGARTEDGNFRTYLSQDRRAFVPALPGGWRRFVVPFRAPRDFPPNTADLSFYIGHAAQKVEIAEVSLQSFGTRVEAGEIEALPRRARGAQFTSPAYGPSDREPDAPWRVAAQQRIEKIRKGDLQVLVTQGGKPVAGAQVRVKMLRHAFRFGTAVGAENLLGAVKRRNISQQDSKRYSETISSWFNHAVLENDLKWPGWDANPERARRALSRLHEMGLSTRGHTLLWPNFTQMPERLKSNAALRTDEALLRRTILEHIREEVGALKGQVTDWDVMNEPFTNYQVMEVLGDSAMGDWFRAAREADPGARLYVNDFDNIEGNDDEHFATYERVIKYLVDNKAPLDGIGLQSHFFYTPRKPAWIVSQLDRLSKFGLPLKITEFDVNEGSPSQRAEITRDLLTVFFSHPNVDAIVLWGFWEKSHWYPNAALLNSDWSLRPNGQAFLDLVHKAWKTDVAGASGADGKYLARGFLGDYEVTATHNGKASTVTLKLEKNGAMATIALP